MMDHELKLIKPGEIRTRIAPSPTGPLHIGTARTALFNYLFAKKNQSSFILRIEDTDLERSNPKWEKDIIENLKWLGIEWTEGPDIGGNYGPYRQSERLKIYEKHIKKLLKEKKAYFCFCSQEELEAHKQYLMSIGEAPRYSGKCSRLSQEEVKKNLASKKLSLIRFKAPAKKLKFTDLIRGKIEFDTGLIGDIAIAKNFPAENKIVPLYNFGVVIDDFEMKISHVIRGEDHLPNTPKQILIQEALSMPCPKYVHLPMVLGTDRSKLSKRHGATAVSDYKKEGYLAEAIINFMAFLGWNSGDEREIFSMNSLIKEFSLENIQKSGAIFNIKKLDYINGFYIRQKSLDKLVHLCLDYLIKDNLIKPEDKEKISPDYLKKIIEIYQQRLKKLSEISGFVDFFFKEKLEYSKNLLCWQNITDKEIENSLDKSEKILSKIEVGDWTRKNLENILIIEAEALAKPEGRGYLLWPLRVALTGKGASAGPFEVAEILGKEKVLKRIQEAKKMF